VIRDHRRREGPGSSGSGAQAQSDQGSLLRPIAVRCSTYAILREIMVTPNGSLPGVGGMGPSRSLTKNISVCGETVRRSVVYVSIFNQLEIGLARSDHHINGPHFMFEYNGKHFSLLYETFMNLFLFVVVCMSCPLISRKNDDTL